MRLTDDHHATVQDDPSQMRFSRRSILASLAGLLVADATSPLVAQQPARPGTRPSQPINQVAGQVPANEKRARPPANDLVVQQVSPQLEKILQDWERNSSQIKSLHGTHERWVYNSVFEVEKRAKGIFFLETPDKGRIDLDGVKLAKGVVSKRTGQSGNPYRVQSDRSEKWICNGNEIVVVNEDEKTFEVIPLPEEMRGKNIVNSPLPFLFGMKADEMKRRFELTLKSNTKEMADIIAVPRLDADKQNYVEALIRLDKIRFLPIAVKLQHDVARTLETVYSFEVKYINDPGIWNKIVATFGDRDPFRPDLKKGYKLVVPALVEDGPRGPNTGQSAPRSKSLGTPPRGSSGGAQPIPRTGTNSGGFNPIK